MELVRAHRTIAPTPRFPLSAETVKTHTHPSAKQTTQDTTKRTWGYVYKTHISARRDEAPVSAAAPATTEKHQETTTQLNTPSLFNYCHIITAIYLHLPHSHQTNTHTGGKRAYRGGRTRADTHRRGWLTKDTRSFILHAVILKRTVWYLLDGWHERVGCLAENNSSGLLIYCGSRCNYIHMSTTV